MIKMPGSIVLTIIFILVFAGLTSLLSMFLVSCRNIEGFVTKHEVYVKPSPKTTYLSKKLVEEWTEGLIQFWFENTEWSLEDIEYAFSGISVTMYDQHYVVIQALNANNEPVTLKVNGFAYPETGIVGIATLPLKKETIKSRVKRLFIHETSHIPAALIGDHWTTAESHHLFKEVNLND